MTTAVSAHVDQFRGPAAGGDCTIQCFLRCADEGQDAPVMVRVHAEVQNLDTGNDCRSVRDGPDNLRISPLAKIRDAFDDLHVYTYA